jgi:hypothetical protein
MKLVKFSTKSTFTDIISKIEDIPMIQKEFIFDLSNQIDYVDFTESDGTTGMFAVIDDWYFNKISDFYKSCGITFTSEDLSGDAFMDDYINVSYVGEQNQDISKDITSLINRFKSNFTNTDIVLDKILEKGVESLNDFDKSYLV